MTGQFERRSRSGARAQKASRSLLVRDLMTSSVLTLRERDSLATLHDLMESRHLRHVPVVDEDGTLVGLVTHRDLLRRTASGREELPMSLERAILRGMTIGEIMTTAVETIEADRDLREAAQLMIENKFGCLPVVEGDELVGILTETDFVRYLA